MNIFKALFSGSGISTADATEYIQNEKPYLLDVRQKNEFKTGHINGAKNIPLDQLASRMKDLPKDREILCICQSGSRSSAAVSQLTRAGYKAINLRGGMMAWRSAGLPVK